MPAGCPRSSSRWPNMGPYWARPALALSPSSIPGWRPRQPTISPARPWCLRAGTGGDLAAQLAASRARDAAAGRTLVGPHRQDLAVAHRVKAMPAARSSTGEQKALLLGLVLAHAELVAERRGEPPILLLDEVAAHLDPKRRAALFTRLDSRGQVWMTATEAALFDGIGTASRFAVRPGQVEPA